MSFIDGPRDESDVNYAICMYILQTYAKLTYTQADVYLKYYVLHWGEGVKSRTSQALYSIKSKIDAKFAKCKYPINEIIQPYVDKIDFILID
jgi:hypothetical protein